jgi:hypothetical protein
VTMVGPDLPAQTGKLNAIQNVPLAVMDLLHTTVIAVPNMLYVIMMQTSV